MVFKRYKVFVGTISLLWVGQVFFGNSVLTYGEPVMQERCEQWLALKEYAMAVRVWDDYHAKVVALAKLLNGISDEKANSMTRRYHNKFIWRTLKFRSDLTDDDRSVLQSMLLSVLERVRDVLQATRHQMSNGVYENCEKSYLDGVE